MASVDGANYTFNSNGNLLSDGQNAYSYDSANRLTSIVNPQSSIVNRYNGLGDRVSQDGVNYTLDLNAGLTQVLSDGTTSYTYGLGRISQANTNTEYFLGDALGSVRQLVDNVGEVTLTKSYDPYGVVLSSAGSGSSTFAYTGEQQDVSGLTYLRARYYNATDGRFLTKDPSRTESNLYTYTRGNPVNRIDPAGLFSKETVEKNININLFAVSSDSWKDHSKWGFYALLRNAENGDRIRSGYASIGFMNTGYQVIWSNPEAIYEVTCNRIMVGSKFLNEYFASVVDESYDRLLWWRDTTRTHYQLDSNGSAPVNFIDGFDNGMSSYPNFVGMSVGLVGIEVGYLVDVYGNKYLAVSGGAGVIGGFAYMEGYLCDWKLLSWKCNQGIPSASEIEKAVSGICGGGEIVILTGINIGALCKDYSLTNWNLTSSVSTFYAGEEIGAGVGATITIPLSWFGVPSNPKQGWKWLIDQRQQYGLTWEKIVAKGLY